MESHLLLSDLFHVDKMLKFETVFFFQALTAVAANEILEVLLFSTSLQRDYLLRRLSRVGEIGGDSVAIKLALIHLESKSDFSAPLLGVLR